ncbi:GH25 family lysozyme [Lactobacillus paragasseri]|uniref:GH25 family lysozyme n=1 Tax=Lactobacillus paragasseri TaxID=2107999 RepID=UPI00217D6A68|nr:GH25 family lysozyme [Lactobacillus paragasseri]UWI43337.1 SH3 domain-containing protein [Lactobacillus paragasseri]UWI44580.1 SH3 domain-containing protein [Lactobacillus paragasseri]
MEVAKRSYGVDVSSYQDTNVANYSGAKFAIVKVSEGLDYRNPKAQSQISTAKANGMLPMAYHYGRFSRNSNVAVQEGNYAVNSAKAVGLNVGSYLALDYEQGSGNETGGDAGANTTAILAFLDTIVSAGYQPLLYSGAALLKSKIDTGKVLAKYPNCLWVASYPVSGATSESNFTYFPSMNGVAIWQFTDNWRGLNVDGNISLIDLKTDSKPVTQPAKPAIKQSTPQSWVDEIGDTWYKEEGKFYPNGTINIRYGARTTSDIIGTVTKGDCVKYDAYSRHGGYVWIRQPRANGETGFLVCRQANTPWGTFK